eukprot:Hpha_TRINITY_DN7463_c0_g1::TRINITY_DN7463_c0_g1_i1::g.95890::m.95890
MGKDSDKDDLVGAPVDESEMQSMHSTEEDTVEEEEEEETQGESQMDDAERLDIVERMSNMYREPKVLCLCTFVPLVLIMSLVLASAGLVGNRNAADTRDTAAVLYVVRVSQLANRLSEEALLMTQLSQGYFGGNASSPEIAAARLATDRALHSALWYEGKERGAVELKGVPQLSDFLTTAQLEAIRVQAEQSTRSSVVLQGYSTALHSLSRAGLGAFVRSVNNWHPRRSLFVSSVLMENIASAVTETNMVHGVVAPLTRRDAALVPRAKLNAGGSTLQWTQGLLPNVIQEASISDRSRATVRLSNFLQLGAVVLPSDSTSRARALAAHQSSDTAREDVAGWYPLRSTAEIIPGQSERTEVVKNWYRNGTLLSHELSLICERVDEAAREEADKRLSSSVRTGTRVAITLLTVVAAVICGMILLQFIEATQEERCIAKDFEDEEDTLKMLRTYTACLGVWLTDDIPSSATALRKAKGQMELHFVHAVNALRTLRPFVPQWVFVKKPPEDMVTGASYIEAPKYKQPADLEGQEEGEASHSPLSSCLSPLPISVPASPDRQAKEAVSQNLLPKPAGTDPAKTPGEGPDISTTTEPLVVNTSTDGKPDATPDAKVGEGADKAVLERQQSSAAVKVKPVLTVEGAKLGAEKTDAKSPKPGDRPTRSLSAVPTPEQSPITASASPGPSPSPGNPASLDVKLESPKLTSVPPQRGNSFLLKKRFSLQRDNEGEESGTDTEERRRRISQRLLNMTQTEGQSTQKTEEQDEEVVDPDKGDGDDADAAPEAVIRKPSEHMVLQLGADYLPRELNLARGFRQCTDVSLVYVSMRHVHKVCGDVPSERVQDAVNELLWVIADLCTQYQGTMIKASPGGYFVGFNLSWELSIPGRHALAATRFAKDLHLRYREMVEMQRDVLRGGGSPDGSVPSPARMRFSKGDEVEVRDKPRAETQEEWFKGIVHSVGPLKVLVAGGEPRKWDEVRHKTRPCAMEQVIGDPDQGFPHISIVTGEMHAGVVNTGTFRTYECLGAKVTRMVQMESLAHEFGVAVMMDSVTKDKMLRAPILPGDMVEVMEPAERVKTSCLQSKAGLGWNEAMEAACGTRCEVLGVNPDQTVELQLTGTTARFPAMVLKHIHTVKLLTILCQGEFQSPEVVVELACENGEPSAEEKEKQKKLDAVFRAFKVRRYKLSERLLMDYVNTWESGGGASKVEKALSLAQMVAAAASSQQADAREQIMTSRPTAHLKTTISHFAAQEAKSAVRAPLGKGAMGRLTKKPAMAQAAEK